MKWDILKCARGVAVVLVLLAVAARASFAATVTNLNAGDSINLSTIVSQGLQVQIGDKLFGDFQFSYSDNNGNTNDDIRAQQINLTALTNDIGFGIRITNAWRASGSTAEDTIFAYSVTVLAPGYSISDAHMTYNGVSTGNSFSAVTEQFFTGGFGAGLVGTMEVHNDSGTDVKQQDSIVFSPTFTKLYIEKDIHLEGAGLDQPGNATISIIDQTFSQIPEPSTFALTLGALAGLACCRRRTVAKL